jgi:outer membrane protein assembly factor BamE
MKKLLILLICLASLAAGCSVYRLDIQQGNVLEPAAYEQLKVGMSRAQVQFLMGTPMIADPFHRDRWDYIYRFKEGGGPLTEERIVLFFDGDALSKVVRDISVPAKRRSLLPGA